MSDHLFDQMRRRSCELLHRNLAAGGILAATPGPRAEARNYTRVFGRDAAICALGMAVSGDAVLREGALRGLLTLAEHQAGNGQIPKFVDPVRGEADFWYLGCIDATLWWLLAVDFLERRGAAGLRERLAVPVRRALGWLQAQEHPRFGLVQQNEASDWADIMPRSGFVLYTNALWYRVKERYGLPGPELSREHLNRLFRPEVQALPGERRLRLLSHYLRRGRRHGPLYLSFVNFGSWGEEGDVFGNLLAILCGLADDGVAAQLLDELERQGVASPWPSRATCTPIPPGSALWRPYMARHRQNLPWRYHNGGAWPFIGGFHVLALARCGRRDEAQALLTRLAEVNRHDDWAFNEWFDGRRGEPGGMRGQSWNAAMWLLADWGFTAEDAEEKLFP